MGKDQDSLDQLFLDFRNFTLVANDGVTIRRRDEGWSAPTEAPSWKDRVRPILELFQDTTHGADLEETRFCLRWTCGDCDIESFRKWKAQELVHQLLLSTANLPCYVNHFSEESEIVEVVARSPGH